jgi:hypothetical protein
VYTPASGPPRCLTTATALDPDLLTQEETLTTIQPQQPAKRRLSLAPPAAELPDTRAAVARALLDRYFPVDNVIADNMLHNLRGDFAAYAEMESDPRYLIGRLQQALTALLQRETPPLDATMTLLAEAIADAISYRSHHCPKCPGEEPCADCTADYNRAGLYESLWRELGTIGELPKGRPELTAVQS